jgi:hypothetical protein
MIYSFLAQLIIWPNFSFYSKIILFLLLYIFVHLIILFRELLFHPSAFLSPASSLLGICSRGSNFSKPPPPPHPLSQIVLWTFLLIHRGKPPRDKQYTIILLFCRGCPSLLVKEVYRVRLCTFEIFLLAPILNALLFLHSICLNIKACMRRFLCWYYSGFKLLLVIIVVKEVRVVYLHFA